MDKVLIIHKSLKDKEESKLKRYASMTPEECLAEVTRMRLIAFPNLDKSEIGMWGNKITIE